jgi:hypothetical protein
LPKSKRRKCPEPPANFDQKIEAIKSGKILKEDKAAIMQAYNEQAYKQWDSEALEACPHCARTFLPDRLIIHLRSCRADSPQKRLFAGSGLGGGASGIIDSTQPQNKQP